MLEPVLKLESRLKELLYRCMEEIRATKAALYTSETENLNENQYELVTQYGFSSDFSRRKLNINDVIVDRLLTKRGVFFVNGVGTEPRFSELLYGAGTDRLLVAPLLSRGRLVGLIDMRDKAGKQPFTNEDVEIANHITSQMLALFSDHKLYGIAAIPLSAIESGSERQVVVGNGATAKTIQTARQIVARDLINYRASERVLNNQQLGSARSVLGTTLVIPGALLVALTAYGHEDNLQLVAASARVSADAMQHFESRLGAWRSKRGEADIAPSTELFYPLGTEGAPITGARIVSMLNAPMKVTRTTGLVFSVAFDSKPDVQTKRYLEAFLRQAEQIVESAAATSELASMRERVALKLVEPDFQKFPQLVEHVHQVAALSERLAEQMGLPSPMIEAVRIAALVHDAGMRLIDDPFTKSALTADELRNMKEHPVVGSALVEPVLGGEIAEIVLSHHERADGTGYPNGLRGDRIPIGSRIIQICDAFIAMTSAVSYKPPIRDAEALDRIRAAAGTQFDAQIANRFLAMMEPFAQPQTR
ncbi:MAG: HD domain-containing phosphohydrolase [Thermoanaerobaculia bacterium]